MKESIVRAFMQRKVPSVCPSDNLEHVMDVMERYGVRHVPVVDAEDRFAGIISERDVLSLVMLLLREEPAQGGDEMREEQSLVRDLMETECASASPHDSISSAAGMILENTYECLPVVDGTRLVGMLTHSDFTRLFVSNVEIHKEAA